MALWVFSIIFCKTIVEYQYNVLVSATMTRVEMVGLTGYLYASAGALSSFLNAFGTQSLLRYVGLGIVLVMSPAAELVAAMGIALIPGVGSAFVGRMLDLTMRWSLNNSAKSLLWIATPRAEQELAKPWIEGTVKKATASVTALAIGVTLFLTNGSLPAIAVLSALIAGLACGACFRMHRLYSANMWAQILKRQQPLLENSFDNPFDPNNSSTSYGEWGTEGGPNDQAGGAGALAQLNESVAASVVQKLIYGPPHVQLYVLRQLGAALPPSAWKELLDAWDTLSAAVQVRVLRMCADDSERFPDKLLLSLLSEERASLTHGERPTEVMVPGELPNAAESTDAVLAHAILACAERKLMSARPALTRFLESDSSRVRAAAATTLIRLGWGIGFGAISHVALSMLEQIIGVPLGSSAGTSSGVNTVRRLSSVLSISRGPSVVGVERIATAPSAVGFEGQPSPTQGVPRTGSDLSGQLTLDARIEELTATTEKAQI